MVEDAFFTWNPLKNLSAWVTSKLSNLKEVNLTTR